MLVFESVFLRGSDLQFSHEDERHFILAHLVPRLGTVVVKELSEPMKGIGKFFSPTDARTFCDSCFADLCYSEDENAQKAARSISLREYSLMPTESREEVRRTLDERRNSGEPLNGEAVKKLSAAISHRESSLSGEAKASGL